MKIFSTEHVFNHPWDRVSIANWIKYPNDHTPHVIHVDFLSRHVDPSTGILHTERLLTCKQPVPSIFVRLFGGSSDNSSLFYERSQVDPNGRTLVLRSRNLTFSHLLQVEETCTYSAQASSSDTKLTQEVNIRSVTGWAHVREAVEDFCVNRCLANAQKGRLALESAIEEIYTDTKGQVLGTLGLMVEKNTTNVFADSTTVGRETE